MAVFEISVNGQLRFAGEEVSAITLATDHGGSGAAERVCLHVGIGEAGDYEVQYLGRDLRPGDEISIKVFASDKDLTDPSPAPDLCSFCGNEKYEIAGLVAGTKVAICNGCIQAFHGAITEGAALPLGAWIRDRSDIRCSFCHRSPPEIPGLVGRNGSAICPECLHASMDLISGA